MGQGKATCFSLVGNCGPAPSHSRFPSGSINATEETTPDALASMVRQRSSSTSKRLTLLAIASSIRFCADKSDSALDCVDDIMISPSPSAPVWDRKCLDILPQLLQQSCRLRIELDRGKIGQA